MGVNSWYCERCTYLHHFAGTRCSMCGELRTSKQQMRDFISGASMKRKAPIEVGDDEQQKFDDVDPKNDQTTNDDSVMKVTNDYIHTNNNNVSVTEIGTENKKTSTKSHSLPPIVNPYAKKGAPKNPQTHQNDVVNIDRIVRTSVPDRPLTIDEPKPSMKSLSNAYPAQRQIMNPYKSSNNCSSTKQSMLPFISENKQSNLQTESVLQREISAEKSTLKENAPITSSIKAKTKNTKKTPKNPPTRKRPKNNNDLLSGLDDSNNYQPGPVPLASNDLCKTWIFPHSDDYPERDYQVQISNSAILQNTLVSLPTGLGKTLIAAVVMYNFYRWFPTGKVVFLAPTKPLVTQQIEACYKIMGIPECHTAEMSGKVSKSNREQLWKERNVFFCTPQTFQNDLEDGRCDAKMVVCIIVDEAHRATGKYAYASVIEMVQSAGASFRVVGLSATPGTTLDNIRKVLEQLRISKIEARSDSDADVQKYVHDRYEERIIVEQTSQVTVIEKILNQIINPMVDFLMARNALIRVRCITSSLTSFMVHKSIGEYRLNNNDNGGMMHSLLALKALITLREVLLEHGVGLAKIKFKEFKSKFGNMAFLKSRSELMNNLATAIHQNDSDDIKDDTTKLKKLEEILTEHFERARACNESSRAIVFSQYRDSVELIVESLQKGNELIKPKQFVGQGRGSTGKDDRYDSGSLDDKKNSSTKVKGMNQKEQQKVIHEFSKGIYNVIVCTCIGEEGLDIGDVDLIVNFDCLRSPIRMVQRTGRTGRKRNGRVVSLVSKGREEKKLEDSEKKSATLWKSLKNSSSFKLVKSKLLLPSIPSIERKQMDITPYRSSQVGGYVQNQRNEGRNSVAAVASSKSDDAWRLSAQEEEERKAKYGELNPFITDSIRKSYIKQHRFTLSNYMNGLDTSLKGSRGKGRSSHILHHLIRFYSKNYSTLLSSKNETKPALEVENNEDIYSFNTFDNEMIADSINNHTNFDEFEERNDLKLKIQGENYYSSDEKQSQISDKDDDTDSINPTLPRTDEATELINTACGDYQYEINQHQANELTFDEKENLPCTFEGSPSRQSTEKRQIVTTNSKSECESNPNEISCMDIINEEHDEALHLQHGQIQEDLESSRPLPASSSIVGEQNSSNSSPAQSHSALKHTSPNDALTDTPISANVKSRINNVHRVKKVFFSQHECGNIESPSPFQPLSALSNSSPALSLSASNHTSSNDALTDTPISANVKGRINNAHRMKKVFFSQQECGNIESPSPFQPLSALSLTSNEALTDTPISKAVQGRTHALQRVKKSNVPRIDNGLHKQISSKRKINNTINSASSSRFKKFKNSHVGSVLDYMDLEAEVEDGDTSDETDDDGFENSQDSFINDSSQLGYTQDNLGIIEGDADADSCDESSDDGNMHRRLDNDRYNLTMSTPVLNRRQKQAKNGNSDDVSGWTQDVPSSDHGLGKMHFIRSVIEYHKQGGKPLDLEKEYNDLIGISYDE